MIELRGQYEISLIQSGKVIDKRILPNVITTNGKGLLYDYLTGSSKFFLSYLALGLGSTAAVVGDSDLVHEIYRGRLESATYDADTDTVTWHLGLLPSEAVGVLEEIAVFDKKKNESGLTADDLLISDFNTADETWAVDVGSLASDTTNYKEGESALKSTTSGGTAVQNLTISKDLDLSGFGNSDKIQIFIYPYATTNLTNIELRLETDASNYYTTTLSSFSAAAWNLKSVAKSSFSTTGSPSWDNITALRLKTTQSAPSAINITFDSLRVVTVNTASKCFSRRVITPAVIKTSKVEALVTYSVTFSYA